MLVGISFPAKANGVIAAGVTVGVVSAFPVSIFTVVSLSEDETAVTTGDASPENVYAPKNSSRPGVVNSMFSPFTFFTSPTLAIGLEPLQNSIELITKASARYATP